MLLYAPEHENIEAMHLRIVYQYVSNHEVYLLNRCLHVVDHKQRRDLPCSVSTP